ncbi:MAG: hypothetical protein HGA90_05940, partial [Alphaproteobacteria bacterium]|nr:hypothetical protein [Alphaproteobacteria bacterium]
MKLSFHNSNGLRPLPAFVLGCVISLGFAFLGSAGYLLHRFNQGELTLNPADASKLLNFGLTFLLAWFSLIVAAAIALGLYMVFRQRPSASLRALAQSIDNLSRGDMQAPIWGLERSDAVGDLARALDLTRLRFGQLPDLTLMSDQGPVRLKFEGEARSLFQAMMKNITSDYERARSEASGFATALATQEGTIAALSARMNAMLSQLQQNGDKSSNTLRQLAYMLTESAKAMALTQEKTSTQLNRLIPYMQERAQNMAEVTQMAGTQITETLKSLIMDEQNLRSGASQSHLAIQQLADAANQMGERLFATVNLMQASSKILSETTETARSRFNEAVEALSNGEEHLQSVIKRAEDRLGNTVEAEENMAALAARAGSSAEQLEGAVHSITEHHEQMGEQVVLATHRMEAIIASFDTAQRAMTDTMQQIRRDGGLIGGLLKDLRGNNELLIAAVGQNAKNGYGTIQSLNERSQALMQRLEAQIEQQAKTAESRTDELASYGQAISQQAQATTAVLAQTVASLQLEQEKFSATRTRLTETVGQIGTDLSQQATETFGKTKEWAEQSFGKLASLTEGMDGLMQRLSILGQLTGTLSSVAGQLGQIMDA